MIAVNSPFCICTVTYPDLYLLNVLQQLQRYEQQQWEDDDEEGAIEEAGQFDSDHDSDGEGEDDEN